MKWTKEQEKAINLKDKNITVSASAGAGKTAVLVARLMKRIIKDRVSVDSIVALTFTEAAASEMKNRLMSALAQEYSKNPDDDYLKEQISLLPSAKISTIHSFCLNILKDYYYVLDLDPQTLNNILSQAVIAEIKENTFDMVLENYPSDKLEKILYRLSASAMNFDSLKDMVEKLSESSLSEKDANLWLDQSIEVYDDFSNLEELPKRHLNLFWAFLEKSYLELKKDAYQLDEIVDSLKDQVNTDNQKEWLLLVVDKLKKVDKALKERDYTSYRLSIEEIAQLKHKNITKQEDFKKAREKYFSDLNNVLEILYSQKQLLNDLSHNKELAKNIIEIVKLYNDFYQQLIKEKKGITFNDMETLTYRLLKLNDGEIAKEISEDIVDILVDEFQDTNTLQNAIIELVGRGDNIFRVGDIKQSIYRFRQAKPQLMQDLINQEDSVLHESIFFKENFRSKKDIVQFNNFVFDKIMNVDNFNSQYTSFDHVKPGREAQFEESKKVNLSLINTEADAYSDLEDNYNLSTHEFRSAFIANKILQLYNEENDGKWNKFTVLVESHKNKEYLRQAFEQANIPYFIAMADGFYDSFGVSCVLAYLKLILDPSDKISLVAILINLYGFSDNQIAKHYLEEENLFDTADKLDKSILKKVNYYHKNQNSLLLSEIIEDILSINNFYEEKISKQSRTNLDLFYDSAVEYQKNNIGIYGFILEIELMQKEKTSEASSISSDDNVVNVMTIHNSKGLQFNTVFLYSKSANHDVDSSSNFVIHPELGLALKSVYNPKRIVKNNIANFLIRHYDYKEELEEEMRKLYVALTRAENRLYIVDTYKESKKKEYDHFDYSHIENKIGYTGWLLAVAQSYPLSPINVEYFENFSYKKADIIVKEEKFIKKLQQSEKVEKSLSYKWPIKPLNFEESEKHFEIGESIHKTIEDLDNGIWTKEDIKKANPNISNYYLNKLLLLNSNKFFRELESKEVYKEHPFIYSESEDFKRGIIDYLAIGDKNVYIVDFKTDNVEDETVLIQRYKEQLNLYKKAIKDSYAKHNIKTFLYSLHLDIFIEI